MQTVFKDYGLSGATTKHPALLRCLKKLEHGDTLIVWKLDGLGRSLRDLITMLDDLKQRGVKFRSLTKAGLKESTPLIGAMANLFAGAFVVYCNSTGHRHGEPDAVGAAEIIVLASQLLRTVDRLEQRAASVAA